jgi:F420-dependent oxidoreductase-like protein
LTSESGKRRLGLHVPSGGVLNRQETIDLVRRAEELGYESIWYGESWGYDAFTTLAWIASHTSRIGLGTHIATLFSRTPAMAAQSAASLDSLSGGRLTLGLGTSGPRVVENWHGERWARPLQRTREYVELLRMALAGKRLDHDGEVFKTAGFRLRDEILRSNIPIMIASIGPRNIELTGEIADGWLPIFLRRDALGSLRESLAAGAERSGRDASALEIAPSMIAAVGGGDARALVRAHIAFYVGGMGTFYNRMMQRFGWAEEAERIKQAWDLPGREGRPAAAGAVTQEMVDTTSAVGDASEAVGRLDEARDAGVTLPILMFPFGARKALIGETLEALAPVRT